MCIYSGMSTVMVVSRQMTDLVAELVRLVTDGLVSVVVAAGGH